MSDRHKTGYAALGRGLNFLLNNCEVNHNLQLNVTEVDVHFHDFQNDVSRIFPIETAAQDILLLNNIDKSKKLFIYVGGFTSHTIDSNSQLVRKKFKTVPNSYLIIINHSNYTHIRDYPLKSYKRSVKYVYSIGKQLAQMLVDLQKVGISAKNIHCIGHSLGAHMLGHTGAEFFQATGQKISRITGLDPAGPCFSSKLLNQPIRSGVAQYVEVYHCNAGALGTRYQKADINFFVNDGQSQPNCKLLGAKFCSPTLRAPCNHKTCVSMWMASITHKDWYKAVECSEYRDFKNGNCSQNQETFAGFWNPGTAKGVYYFSTKAMYTQFN